MRSTIAKRLLSTFLLVVLSAAPYAALWAADQPPAPKPQRTVRFTLRDQERSSLTSMELRLPLTVELSREPTDPEQIFMMTEGTIGGRLWASMTSNGEAWQGTVLLDPSLVPQTAGKSESFRIEISFARVRGMKLSRFLKRSVYIAMATGNDICTVNRRENEGVWSVRGGLFVPADAEAANPAIREEPINETHLAGAYSPEGGAAYWWGIKQRIAERWNQNRKRRGLTLQTKTAPRIHFRLYVNGVPQTVYLERSSGHSRTDEAAVASVLESQPFAPFPSGIGRCYLDVRVDLDSAKRLKTENKLENR